MPRKPPTPCRHPGCPELSEGRFCPRHEGQVKRACQEPTCPELTTERYCPKHKRARRRQSEKGRGSATKRGYGAAWRKKRASYLAKNKRCAICGGKATEVDHIVPLRRGGSNKETNLQALCKSCHSRKTAIEDGGGWG